MPAAAAMPEKKDTRPDGHKRSLSETLSAPVVNGIQKLSEGYYAATYIPDQSDPLGIAVTEAVRHGPFFLLFRDIWTCVTMFTLFPGVVTPFFSKEPTDEFYIGWGPNIFGLFLLSFASVFEVLILIACVPLFIFLPGPVSVLLFVTGQVLIHLICFPMQGPSKVWSKNPTDPRIIAQHNKSASERWFFLNGCCVSGHNLQNNVDLLSATFGRPIFAIHNRTYGVLGDLFECIVQRSFDLFTEETRVCYEYIKAYCTDPEVKKVVIIAHSQGCIMASQILDQLYVDLPAPAVSKLEVYTFGNAASHFNNPLRKLASTPTSIDARDIQDGKGDSAVLPTMANGSNPKAISAMQPERVIEHIEHYCNSQDMVTRWGALYSAKSILQNRFCGHIFINEGASGHMLNQHYLSKMFPVPKGLPNGYPGDEEDPYRIPFLDRIVNLDTATVTQRNAKAVHQLAVMRHESAPHDPDDHSHQAHTTHVHDIHEAKSRDEHKEIELNLKLGEGTKLTSKDLSGAEGSRISVVKEHDPEEEDVKGRTVRQLSRLWRYLDGADPDSPRDGGSGAAEKEDSWYVEAGKPQPYLKSPKITGHYLKALNIGNASPGC